MGRKKSHLVTSKRSFPQDQLTTPPGLFLVMHFISKELGLRSLMHLKQKIMVSTFLMGAQFKHHSCPVQKSNILHITTT
jgi:hypothetical protein